MAKKLRYPQWTDWLAGLEAALKQALTTTGLVSYRIDGAPTNLQVAIKSADQHQGHMPYVEVILADVQNGWDDSQSGQLDYDGSTYTTFGDNKQVKSLNYVRERITFQIDVFTQKHVEAIAIAQAIRRHFNAFGEIQITWQGTDVPVFTKLHDFSMEAVEAGREGKLEYFRASYLFTFSIISEQTTSDLIVKAISEVVAEQVTTIGGDEEDTRTKTLS